MSPHPTDQIAVHTVVGMTCDHCAVSVTKEVANVAGVDSVDVDLASGRLAVSGRDVSDAAVAQAVERAGYEVAP